MQRSLHFSKPGPRHASGHSALRRRKLQRTLKRERRLLVEALEPRTLLAIVPQVVADINATPTSTDDADIVFGSAVASPLNTPTAIDLNTRGTVNVSDQATYGGVTGAVVTSSVEFPSSASKTQFNGNQFDPNLSIVDGAYNGLTLTFILGANSGVSRVVTSYVGLTHTFTFATAFPGPVSSFDIFNIGIAKANQFNGDASLSDVDDSYNGEVLTFVSGPLYGQSQIITSYIGASQTFKFAVGFSAPPSEGDGFFIEPINAPPDFLKGADIVADDEASTFTIPGWATQISPGPASDAGQQVHFVVAADRPELFAIEPAIDPTGTLTFQPQANSNGTATITVTLVDDGGTANGGSDTSPPQTLLIDIMKLHPWHNAVVPGDVDQDSHIAPGDALAVINYINSVGPGPIKSSTAPGGYYYDVDGDDFIAPSDALLVINYINAHPSQPISPTGEGEAAVDAGLLLYLLANAPDLPRRNK